MNLEYRTEPNYLKLKELIKSSDLQEVQLDVDFSKFLPALEEWNWGKHLPIFILSSTPTKTGYVNTDVVKQQREMILTHTANNDRGCWIIVNSQTDIYNAFRGITLGVKVLKNFYIYQRDICEAIQQAIRNRFHCTIPLSDIVLMESITDMRKHTDLHERTCIINTFLSGGEAAELSLYNDESDIPYKTLITQTGKSYLLNGAVPHSVKLISDTPRYSISISIY